MPNLVARAAWTLARVMGAGPMIQRAAMRNMSARVLPDLAIWSQFQRTGGGLTPAQVSGILREADSGDMRRLVDLGNDMRQKDGHLQGILSQVEEAIGELEWKIVPPESAKARDKRAAKFVEGALRSCKGEMDNPIPSDLSSLIAHIVGGFFYSYSVSEIRWVKRADGYIVPAAFTNHSPRRFGFRQSDSALVWRDDGMDFNGVEFKKLYPNRFVVGMPRVTGDVRVREGLIRVLVWAALFRNWSITDWLRTAELSWKPWRLGKFKKDKASDEDISGLNNVLTQLSTNGSAILPDSTEVQVFWPQGDAGGGRKTHGELFDVVGREMSKATLGQTDTVDGSRSTGYAQTKVMSEAEKRRIRSRARFVASIITRDVVRPMVMMNFGKGVAVPDFVFVMSDPVDIQRFADGVSKLVGAGANVTQAYVRDQVGMPEPTAKDDLLKPAATTQPASPPVGEPDADEAAVPDDAVPPSAPAAPSDPDAAEDDSAGDA